MGANHVVPTGHFPPLRMAVLLAATALLEAGAACWALGAGGLNLPFSGAIPVELLPQLLGGLALALAVFCAPLFFSILPLRAGEGGGPSAPSPYPLPQGERGTSALLGPAFFASVWQAGSLGFALLVLGRLTPLAPAGILQTCVWLALCALAGVFLAQLCPRAFAGIMFTWIIALPVSGYFLAEAFLSSPGGAGGWTSASGGLRGLLHWLLSLSPGTALSGALTGLLPDGSVWAWKAPFLLLCILNGVLYYVHWAFDFGNKNEGGGPATPH
ncbi:MAG: hypothetical protein ABSE73_06510 [Planctomycetota bacterium]